MTALLRRSLPSGQDAYGWELKWDGVRAVAYVQEGGLRLRSRNDRDITHSYPELAGLARVLPRPAILDGEIVALRDGRPSFATLQLRMHVQHPGERLVRSVPVQYYLFDLLHLDDESLLPFPYTERRDRLDALGLDEEPVRVPPWWRGDGEAVFAVGLAQGLEGVVGKPLRSRYHPGRRGPWIKVKNVRHQEVVVAGWIPGAGRRADLIGSLSLGVYDGDRLRYAGNVGTGFTEADLRDMAARLAPLARDEEPFDPPAPREVARRAHWVRPALVGEVAFGEWTPDGVLRHPSWRGLRPDKQPREVHREDPG
ncbi:non-homologous end-joining DNA ligase [Actinoallomurus sp. CA-150999]|uniref:non-homologous end-joining DNA ligase n=1 Tax=Actinoallomurus sp. CA-150999 TaxID=3239887 RepID=UPI003D93D6A8